MVPKWTHAPIISKTPWYLWGEIMAPSMSRTSRYLWGEIMAPPMSRTPRYLGREIMAPSVSRTSIPVGFDYFSNFHWHTISSSSVHTIPWRGDYGAFHVQNFHIRGEIMAPSTSRTSIYIGFSYFPTEPHFNKSWHSISFFHTHTIQIKWTLKWTWSVSRGVFTYVHIYGLLGLPIRVFSYWVMCTFYIPHHLVMCTFYIPRKHSPIIL